MVVPLAKIFFLGPYGEITNIIHCNQISISRCVCRRQYFETVESNKVDVMFFAVFETGHIYNRGNVWKLCCVLLTNLTWGREVGQTSDEPRMQCLYLVCIFVRSRTSQMSSMVIAFLP